MKKCWKCQETKSKDEFGINNSRSDGRQTLCMPCNKAKNKAWYIENKQKKIDDTARIRAEKIQWLKDYKKTLVCSRCPENYPYCLDFHHESDKIIHVSKAIRQWGLDRVKEEIAKCIVLCANCHRKETFGMNRRVY